VPEGVPVAFLLLGLTIVSLAGRRVHEPRIRLFRWSAADVAAAFLLVNGLLYLPLAPNLVAGIYGYHELFRMFLLYFVVRLMAPDRRTAAALLWAAGITLFVVVAYGCVQHFWGFDYVLEKYNLVESLRDYVGLSRGGIQ